MQYTRSVQYYETDMMGVVHHANYIHWMEEARIAFMDQIGFPYTRMEEEGVISPVVELSCEYKKPCTFGDKINISVTVESFSGVKLVLIYEMYKQDGEKVCSARSEHTFLNRDGHFARMKRDMPQFCAAIDKVIQESYSCENDN